MMSHSPVPDDDEEEEDGLIAVLEGQTVFLHGASSLPKQGESVEQRPCITPYGVSTWTEAGDEASGKCRHVNGVIGILLKEHFPGMVTLPGEGNVLECLLEEKLIVERQRAAAERAAERAKKRRLTAEERAMERAEERRQADERTQHAVWAQNTQNFHMFTAYCTQYGMPGFDFSALTPRSTHLSTNGSNNAGSSHAHAPGNNLDGSPHL
ncbi:hypothetical protein ZWY2020_021789 [Hordeum vulgare]|nr:hypothetical protein ZWY2020_021789 [Hordeum vulgare]